MRLLIDTNVLLDIVMQREPFNETAKQFLLKTRENKDELYICASSLRDLSYQGHRLLHSWELTNNMLIDIYSRVTKVVGLTVDDTIEALYLDGDYEDNLIALTAETTMCDAIISRDKKFENFKFVLTPEKYLEIRNK